MLSGNIILQSAGSLSVAVMALLMLILQTLFFFRKPQFTWYAWSAAISFSALLYSVGIFIEYNTPAGPLNRFSGLSEYTAIICLVHCLYGFTFSYLGIESKHYNPVAGVCHGLILILLWFTNYVVAESFITRDFIGLESPYIEPALGPIGPVFVLYAAIAGMTAMTFWIKHKRTDAKHRIIFLVGMGFWLLLGIHDGLASLGLPSLQYFMEYGFLGFAMVVLWVVFNNYLEIAAEEKYRVITEFANDCIMVIQDGKMVFRNPACYDLTRGPLFDSAARDFLDIMVTEDRKTVLKHYNTLLEGGHVPNPHTVRVRGVDGEKRFIEIVSSLIQYRNRPAVLAIMRDITDRKRAEEALQTSEERYRLLAENATDTIWVMELDGRFTYHSPSVMGLRGYTPEEANSFSMQETMTPESLTFIESIFDQENSTPMKERWADRTIELSMYKKDGSVIHAETSVRAMRDAEGNVVSLQGSTRDITERAIAQEALEKAHEELEMRVEERTVELYKANEVLSVEIAERKQAQEALRESEEKYRTMMESMKDPVYICSPDFQVEYMNPSMIRRTGRDATGENCFKTLHDLDAKCPWCMHYKSQQGEYYESKIVSPKDNRSYHISSSPIVNGDGSISKMTVFRDTTDLKKLETQLQHAQKMEAMGLMAGGVAHDLNNILSGIVSYPELLLMNLPEDSPLRKPIKTIQESGMRAADVVEDLMTIARGVARSKEVLNLNTLVEGYLKSVEHQKLERTHSFVNFKTELDPDLLNMSGSPTHIKKTLMNLVTNASEQRQLRVAVQLPYSL